MEEIVLNKKTVEKFVENLIETQKRNVNYLKNNVATSEKECEIRLRTFREHRYLEFLLNEMSIQSFNFMKEDLVKVKII